MVNRHAMHFISHRYDYHLQCGETCMLKSAEVRLRRDKCDWYY